MRAIVTLALAAVLLAGASSRSLSQDALDPWAGSSLSSSSYDSLSYNSSSLTNTENSFMTYAPATLNVGKGYYASHTIGYSSMSSQRTSIQNMCSGTSMQLEAQDAHGLYGERNVSAYENSYSWNGHEYVGGCSVQMKINEDVTDGRIHVGALQAGPGPEGRKDPILDVNEDYVGTYHIQENMSIGLPYRTTQRTYGWLFAVDNYLPVYDSWYRSSPEKIFDSGSPRKL
jgi:hypothetical protein